MAYGKGLVKGKVLDMLELVDILDENGNKTGQVAPRMQAWQQSLWHRSVSAWIVNSDGEILVQRRSPHKKNFPNMWDKSVGGSVDAGESAIDAIVREATEEIRLNISPDDFIFIGSFQDVFKMDKYDMRLIHDVYVVRGDYKVSDMVLQQSEVAEVRYVTPAWIDAHSDITDPENSILGDVALDMLIQWMEENKE